MRDVRERLQDILEAIARIERYAGRGREAFMADELIQTWIVHNLQVIGEAAGRMPEDVRAAAPSIPWTKITGMRHVLVHDYFGIDLDLVWSVVVNELSPLAQAVRDLLASA